MLLALLHRKGNQGNTERVGRLPLVTQWEVQESKLVCWPLSTKSLGYAHPGQIANPRHSSLVKGLYCTLGCLLGWVGVQNRSRTYNSAPTWLWWILGPKFGPLTE